MLNQHDRREKQLLAIVREIDDLKRLWNRPISRKLDKPFQRGWKRFYVLTAAAERRDDSDVLRAILSEINITVYCRRPDFKRRERRSKKLIEINRPVRKVSVGEWERNQYPDSWKKYFRFLKNCRWPWASDYEFLHPWLFELRTEKHWMTHYWDINPAVIGRLAELEDQMEYRQLWPVYARLKGKSAGRYWRPDNPRHDLLARVAAKEIHGIVACGQEAETHSFSERMRFSLLVIFIQFMRR